MFFPSKKDIVSTKIKVGCLKTVFNGIRYLKTPQTKEMIVQ